MASQTFGTNIRSLLIVLAFFASPTTISAQAQLIANSGRDTFWCLGNGSFIGAPNPPSIGGHPAATGGTGPYRYLWTITQLGFNAQDYLDSDTIPNPTLKAVPPYPYDSLYFLLQVTDANDSTAFMFSKVRFAYWGSTLHDPFTKTRDTVTLSAKVFPMFPPAIYQWSPGTFLSDSTIPTPSCWTPHSIVYTVTVTDGLGCSLPSEWLSIIVPPTLVGEMVAKDDDLLIFPAPARQNTMLRFGEAWSRGSFSLLDATGRLVFRRTIQPGELQLVFPALSTGQYFYLVRSQNGAYRCGKIYSTE